jgi:hypothetical protein
VAIVQISRVTQRKGLQEDLPQPLASAELGWSTDQRRLFIGNGTVEEGAPIVGNTEILTEFSDLLAFNSGYTYKGSAAGYVAQTGPTPGTPITQSLQNRLDSFVVVTDFGAQGDGVTDDTSAINRALNQLYCVQVNPQIRRGLYFPAGVYKITDTILIPPYARLYGDGAESSILQFQVDYWVSGTAYPQNILVKNLVGSVLTYYRALVDVPALLNGSPILLSDTNYWQSTALPDYAFNTADSQQQTGSNIGLNGAVTPQHIDIQGLGMATLEYLEGASLGHNLLLLDRVSNSEFNRVSFYGPLEQISLNNDDEELCLISADSTSSLPVSSIAFDQCVFRNATYAVNTDNLTAGITISNGTFDTLYQGVVLGSASPVNGGPSGVRIMHNTFDNIYEEGVVINSCGLNATGYNTFYDVGNHFNGVTNPAASIITINADDNISVGDLFQRSNAYATTYPRIQLYDITTSTVPVSIALTNGKSIQMGSYQRQSGQQTAIVDGAANQPIITVDSDQPVSAGGYTSFTMNYTIYRDTPATHGVRTGTLMVCGSPGSDSAGEVIVYTDDYNENENIDVTLTVSENGSDMITVSYTAASTGYNGVIYYSLSSVG